MREPFWYSDLQAFLANITKEMYVKVIKNIVNWFRKK